MGKAKWTKEVWLERYGFNTETEMTYIIYGDDTYHIKDWLKEQGCKFNPILKWHAAVPIELPEGYGMVSVSFDEVAEYSDEYKAGFFKETARALVDRKVKEAMGPSLSEYVGAAGDRLKHITAIYKSTRGFMGSYGWTNIHTFEQGHDVLVWFTQCDLPLEYGTVVDLSGTVKRHEEFRGVKTTHLSRCVVKEVK